jgi:AcrR family transcriptional regulator
MNKKMGRGRRPGSPDTQEAIRLAARDRFLRDGYQGVTMRSVATDAGVDVALVSYYFGSKQGLFGAAMALPANPADLLEAELAGDRETLPERLLRSLLFVWDSPETGAPLRALAGNAASDPDLNRLVREVVGREIIGRLAGHLGTPDAPQRAATFATQIAGLIFSRYIFQFEPMASMSPDDIVERLAPSLRLALGPTLTASD